MSASTDGNTAPTRVDKLRVRFDLADEPIAGTTAPVHPASGPITPATTTPIAPNAPKAVPDADNQPIPALTRKQIRYNIIALAVGPPDDDYVPNPTVLYRIKRGLYSIACVIGGILAVAFAVVLVIVVAPFVAIGWGLMELMTALKLKKAAEVQGYTSSGYVPPAPAPVPAPVSPGAVGIAEREEKEVDKEDEQTVMRMVLGRSDITASKGETTAADDSSTCASSTADTATCVGPTPPASPTARDSLVRVAKSLDIPSKPFQQPGRVARALSTSVPQDMTPISPVLAARAKLKAYDIPDKVAMYDTLATEALSPAIDLTSAAAASALSVSTCGTHLRRRKSSFTPPARKQKIFYIYDADLNDHITISNTAASRLSPSRTQQTGPVELSPAPRTPEAVYSGSAYGAWSGNLKYNMGMYINNDTASTPTVILATPPTVYSPFNTSPISPIRQLDRAAGIVLDYHTKVAQVDTRAQQWGPAREYMRAQVVKTGREVQVQDILGVRIG